ncbi:MAG: hypothetical protein A3E34_01775 [Candidatus Yanofskybacteria bacterium RIFCSPHIGHO2_12_FULL_43_11]|nr:MAG: hypothetical protein A3E34_01775 [Candidatus Yanofskybacteria bacterium RIFCSPHIGHO2_12_FULL_43_11]
MEIVFPCSAASSLTFRWKSEEILICLVTRRCLSFCVFVDINPDFLFFSRPSLPPLPLVIALSAPWTALLILIVFLQSSLTVD